MKFPRAKLNLLYAPSDMCSLPPDRGPCDASIRRWYFDSEQQICVDFVYGGCRGNNNNFATKKKCRLICKSRLRDNMATPPPRVPATSATEKPVTGTELLPTLRVMSEVPEI